MTLWNGFSLLRKTKPYNIKLPTDSFKLDIRAWPSLHRAETEPDATEPEARQTVPAEKTVPRNDEFITKSYVPEWAHLQSTTLTASHPVSQTDSQPGIQPAGYLEHQWRISWLVEWLGWLPGWPAGWFAGSMAG